MKTGQGKIIKTYELKMTGVRKVVP